MKINLPPLIVSLIVGIGVPVSTCAATVDPAVDSAIRQQAKLYQAAFNRHDAKAVAALWTKDATYMDAEGHAVAGINQLEQLFSKYFADHPNDKLRIEVKSIDSSGPGVAIERGVAWILDAHDNPVSGSPYMAVDQLVDGKWRVAHANEGAAFPPPRSLGELSWLVGNWQAGDGKNGLLMKNDLVGDGNFLITTFERPPQCDSKETDLMVTTVNRKTGALEATVFDSKGGFGHGEWRRLADGSWTLSILRTEPDQMQIAGTHIIRPADEHSFHWKTTERTVNGVHLKDAEETVVTKVR